MLLMLCFFCFFCGSNSHPPGTEEAEKKVARPQTENRKKELEATLGTFPNLGHNKTNQAESKIHTV